MPYIACPGVNFYISFISNIIRNICSTHQNFTIIVFYIYFTIKTIIYNII